MVLSHTLPYRWNVKRSKKIDRLNLDMLILDDYVDNYLDIKLAEEADNERLKKEYQDYTNEELGSSGFIWSIFPQADRSR